jgi:hypothetical protein
MPPKKKTPSRKGGRSNAEDKGKEDGIITTEPGPETENEASAKENKEPGLSVDADELPEEQADQEMIVEDVDGDEALGCTEDGGDSVQETTVKEGDGEGETKADEDPVEDFIKDADNALEESVVKENPVKYPAEVVNGTSPKLPPNPLSVPVNKEITIEDTINMRQHQHILPSEESLVVHVDDTQYDLDSDLGPSKSLINSSAASLNDDVSDGGKSTPQQEEGAAGDATATADAGPVAENGDTAEEKMELDEGKAGEEETNPETEQAKNSEEKLAAEISDSKPEKPEENLKPEAKSAVVEDAAKEKDLWISNLGPTTRATDLKTIFSKYGKVVGAKVMTNAKIPGETSPCHSRARNEF